MFRESVSLGVIFFALFFFFIKYHIYFQGLKNWGLKYRAFKIKTFKFIFIVEIFGSLCWYDNVFKIFFTYGSNTTQWK